MKILILKPSSLGDVIQALPVLRLLKLHWPDSKIHWWIDSSLASLVEGDRDLEGVVLFERQRWAAPVHWPEMWKTIQWMRRQEFDLVIDLQCLARTGVFAWLANGRLLVGLDEPREGARGYYDIIVPRESFGTHAVDWYLSVLRALNVPVDRPFDWIPERPAVAAELKRKWEFDSCNWVLLQPGARWMNKRWPVEHWTELVRRWTATDSKTRFAVLGSASETDLGAAIVSADPDRCLNLTGCLSLPEMIEWIRLAKFMVSNDTGPMHVAAALGRPLLALFGPTTPRRTGPYGQTGNILQESFPPCVPCMRPVCTYVKPIECLRAITPDRVIARMKSAFADE